LKNHLILSFVIIALLVMSFQTTNVAGSQSISIESLDENQAPIVNSPIDIVYYEGSTGYSITWEISDNNPSYWITTRNGEILNAMPWETLNETVIVDVDGLVAGNYEFKIYACDDIHNITDVVMVAVLSSEIEVHTPFSIGSNTQFNTTAQSEGWVGNGSITNPYIIEKLWIEASYDCISIHETTVHFIIRNCTFVKLDSDSGIGLDLQYVNNGIIKNCTFTNLWVGCINWFISNCTWNSNTFGNLMDGIWLNEATNCTIVDNTFMSGGVSISGYNPSNWIHEISGNMIDERPIGYFQGVSTLDIDVAVYGQVIVANCHEVEIHNGNFQNTGSAISIGHSNFSDVYDCEIQGGRFGIFLEHTNWIDIENCYVVGSSEIGMYINETLWTTVYNCTIQNIGYVGIQIGMASNTSIINSVILNCGDMGITCFESPYFFLGDSFVEENGYGLYLGGSPDSRIAYNEFLRNNDIGLYILWGCEGTIIDQNAFVLNTGGNAYDDGTDTYWDSGYPFGNLWSDYEDSGFYYIPGSRNGIDHYPGGMVIVHKIEVFQTADISYTVGTTGHYITWETNCTHPSTYSIFKDGVLQIQQPWGGSAIVYNIDGLALGEYNFTVKIMDEFSETASDTVIVDVIPPDPIIIITTALTNTTTTTTSVTTNTTIPIGMQELSLMISIGSAAVIVIVVVLILKSKKGAM